MSQKRYIYNYLPLDLLQNHSSLWTYEKYEHEDPIVYVQLFHTDMEAKKSLDDYVLTTCVVATRGLNGIIADNGRTYNHYLLLCNLITKTKKSLETFVNPEWTTVDRFEIKQRVQKRKIDIQMDDVFQSLKAFFYVYTTDFRKVQSLLERIMIHINTESIDYEVKERFHEITDENVMIDVSILNDVSISKNCFYRSSKTFLGIYVEIKKS